LSDFFYKFEIEDLKIVPLINNKKFTFTYEVIGLKSEKVKKVFIKSISGDSSFVDFLLFYQDEMPDNNSVPLYAIEETKTDDSESRNTGVYQRCSKFVFIEFYYPNIKKIMLYNLQIKQKEQPTPTYIFGTKMLLTLGVEIMGKQLDYDIFKPFKNIDELIEQKNEMAKPHYGIPVKINKNDNGIFISAKLEKDGKLTHDPNIGMTSIISSCLRRLGWVKNIIIKEHNLLNQNSVGTDNKFILIANQINIKLDGLEIPKANIKDNYWKYELNQEKLATIFLHLICEEFANAKIIYENHGGCERGYFITSEENYIALPKYKEGQRKRYKKGNKKSIIFIPDLVIYDKVNNEIINIEGKVFNKRKNGIKELKNFKYLEKTYIEPDYNPSKIIRTVAVYGSDKTRIAESKIGFMLNQDGEMIIRNNSPRIFKEAIKILLSNQ